MGEDGGDCLCEATRSLGAARAPLLPPSHGRCPSKVIDCHWEARSTQPDLSAMPIGQAPQCQVTFTVLGTTSSSDGGHRIKLSAVMVSKLNGDWIPAANLGVQAAIG